VTIGGEGGVEEGRGGRGTMSRRWEDRGASANALHQYGWDLKRSLPANSSARDKRM
jgi:hypothetical protein